MNFEEFERQLREALKSNNRELDSLDKLEAMMFYEDVMEKEVSDEKFSEIPNTIDGLVEYFKKLEGLS